ncbi:MAG: hypothetical protein JWQ42_4648 [Edaphobacter sp.]|nr:hypothetical protein [Edaphobacter sp.]
MKTALLLRGASVLALLHGVMHTIGGVFGEAAPGAQQTAVSAMKANQFDAMGATRTYWDFFMGFGLFITVSFLVQAVVFWQLAAMAKVDAVRTRPIVMAFCVGYVAYAVLSWRYFFVVPVVFELVIAACLLGAWVTAGKESQQSI